MHNKINNDPVMNVKEKMHTLRVFKDADFWFRKGANTQREDNIVTAIDCYKQAILINPCHYPSIYNLAICYERQNKLKCSNA
jgi:tetratricopeptide (TPR) repeat protein